MQEITQDFEVKVGDILEFDYNIIGIFESAQIEALIDKIQRDGRMSIVDYEVEKRNWYSDRLKIKVKIIQNPFPVVVLVIAIGSIATSLFLYLALDKIYLIAREAPEALGTVNFGLILLIGVGGFIAYKFLR